MDFNGLLHINEALLRAKKTLCQFINHLPRRPCILLDSFFTIKKKTKATVEPFQKYTCFIFFSSLPTKKMKALLLSSSQFEYFWTLSFTGQMNHETNTKIGHKTQKCPFMEYSKSRFTESTISTTESCTCDHF